jgi:hypothetical protein
MKAESWRPKGGREALKPDRALLSDFIFLLSLCGVSDGYCPRYSLLHRQAPHYSASDTTSGWRSWIRTSAASFKGSRPTLRRSSNSGAAGWGPTSALAVRSGLLLPLSYGGVWCARSGSHRDLLVFSQTRRLTTPQAHGSAGGRCPRDLLATNEALWLTELQRIGWGLWPPCGHRGWVRTSGLLGVNEALCLAELRGGGRAAWICTRVSCVSDTGPAVGRRLGGSSGRVRSCNPPVNSRALYQLSY